MVHFVFFLSQAGISLFLSPKFVNGQEVIDELPDAMKNSMFTLLSEDDFRLDISSTELRKKQSDL